MDAQGDGEMKLPQAELWLVDWITCGQGEAVSGQKTEELMRYRELRERIWRAQITAELNTKDVTKPAEAELELSESECEWLLAAAPTTFRWGTGEDVGFTLKRRLALHLWKDEEIEKHKVNAAVAAMLGEGSASNTDDQPNKGNAEDAASD